MLNSGMSAADITERLLHGLGGNDTGFQLTPRWVPLALARRACCRVAGRSAAPDCTV